MDQFDDAQDVGPMPGQPTAPGKGAIVIDIPGIGVRSFDPKLGMPQIQENIRVLQQETHAAAASRGTAFNGDVAHRRLKNMMTNPEAMAGAASFIPGAGMGTAAAVGAGTSLARDAMTGHLDPIGSTARAAGHAAVNAIPGAVGGMVARRTIPKATEMLNAALEGKSGLIKSVLQAMVGSGAPAGVARGTAQVAGDLAGMELPGGIAVVSKEGITALKKAQVAIANQGKAFGDAQFDALDELIKRATDALSKQGTGLPNLAQGANAGITTSAERGAMQSAAAEADAAKQGATISSRLRKLLGLVSEGADATGMQGR